jgi:hypothetical protein
MHKRITIRIPWDILTKVNQVVGSKLARSAVIEQILRVYFEKKSVRKAYARDLERINVAADRLNAEAGDVLTYQSLRS